MGLATSIVRQSLASGFVSFGLVNPWRVLLALEGVWSALPSNSGSNKVRVVARLQKTTDS